MFLSKSFWGGIVTVDASLEGDLMSEELTGNKWEIWLMPEVALLTGPTWAGCVGGYREVVGGLTTPLGTILRG